MNRVLRLSYSYRNFGKMSLDPFERVDPRKNVKAIEEAGENIYQWARDRGARYFSFLAFPHTEGIAEKQDSFLRLDLAREKLIKHIATQKLSTSDLVKGEGDGSSFPNGGLRNTSAARGYFVWDWKSPVFIRRNGVLYIPALLLNHNGEALDEKTLYRKAEGYINRTAKKVLDHMGYDAKDVFPGLGLEQQFFVIPKSQFLKRLDLHQTGRALIGRVPPHNQQFSDHYYGNMEPAVEKILGESEDELLEIGVPIKTRHKEVAPNQYEFCSVFEDASRAIDQNLIKMNIISQACNRDGFVPLWHEKPFAHLNGSGKHMNWSLEFYDQDNKKRNLFIPSAYNDDLFLLFTLTTLKALLNHQKLYLASVAVPGNELRLGGHEAPPRIISAFVGEFVNNMIQKLPEAVRGNLRSKVEHLLTDVTQANTDRNRTSPYGFSTNRFQFRAVGSTQNCYFPMTVILSTIGFELEKIGAQLDQGKSIREVIDGLVDETAAIRFEGDGYSENWVKEAKKRGLYVNTRFTENLENIINDGKVLVDSGVYKESQLKSKAEISKQRYIMTVEKQAETILIILNKNILPRAYQHLSTLPESKINRINQKRQNFENKLDKVLEEAEQIDKKIKKAELTLSEAEKVRSQITELGQLINQLTEDMPASPEWPELYDILGRF